MVKDEDECCLNDRVPKALGDGILGRIERVRTDFFVFLRQRQLVVVPNDRQL